MIEEQASRRPDERPSEAELQAIAKAEFQNQLARYCDMQREHPRHRAMHSPANLAYADYYQRMIDTGRRPQFASSEEAALLALGYPLERLERLKIVIEQHHGGGQPAIKPSTLAFHLRGLGFEPNRILSAMVERALYPAYRDACLEAEVALGSPRPAFETTPEDPSGTASKEALSPVPAPGPALGELIEIAIVDLRAEGRWDDKLCRQATTPCTNTRGMAGLLPETFYARARDWRPQIYPERRKP